MKTRMEKEGKCFWKGKMAFFASVLLLIALFSHTPESRAHNYTDIPIRQGYENNHAADSVKAEDVEAGDMEGMRELVLHARAHIKQLADYSGGLAPFLRKIEKEGGDWRKDGIYIFRMSDEGTIQPPHPRYPLAQGGNLNEYAPMGKLRGNLEDAEKGTAECVGYEFEGETRAACAVSSDLEFQYLANPIPTVLVAGLDHDFEDVSFSGLQCPYRDPETSAVDVVDRDTLKEFVDEFARFYVELVNRPGGTSNFIDSLNCFRVLPWKRGSVYLFAMTEDTRLVVLNGNTPSLENRSLNVVDANGTNVGDLIVSALEDKDSYEGVFVEYLWDDPTDDVPAITEEGRAPGDVPKLSYVVKTPLGISGRQIIWGSGIYPETGGGDDGGCAVAGTSPGNKDALFILLVAASSVFFVTFCGNRFKGK